MYKRLKKRKTIWLRGRLLLLVSLLIPLAGQAEDPPKKTIAVIKLADVVKEALSKNAELSASREETIQKEAQIGPSGSYEDPTLGVEMMNFPVDSFSRSEYGMTGVQTSISQKIPFPGKLTSQRRATASLANAQKEMVSQKQLDLIRDVKRAYYLLALAYKKQSLLEEQKSLTDQLISSTRNNYSVGKASQAEVLGLQVDGATLIDQLLVNEKEIKKSLSELSHLVGRSSHKDLIEGKPEEIRKTSFNFKQYSEEAIIEKALEKNPMILSKKAEIEASKAKVSYANWNYLPDFEFKLGYTFRKPSPGDNGKDFVSGMVGVTIPIWAWNKQSEEKRGAEAEKAKTEALLSEERNTLSHKVHTIYADLEESDQRVKLFEGGVLPLVKQSVTSGRSAYLVKKIPYSTLVTLITKRFQTEFSYQEALSNFQSKIAELEAAVGEELGDRDAK